MRINGSIIGSNVTPGIVSGASGIWSMQNVEIANRSRTWPTNIVTNGLVLFLDASNTNSYTGSGTTWTDLSSYGNTATLTNGPTFSSTNGGNIVFDGVDDYTDVIISNLTTTVTLEFWAKYTTATTNNMLFGFNLYDIYASSGAIGFNTFNGDIYGLTSTQVTNLGIIGNWKHIVFVMRSDVSYTNNKIYVNVVNQSLSQVLSSELASNRNFNSGNGRISGTRGDSGYKFPGSISSFRAYNRELTASEVLQNFNLTRDRFGV